MSSVQILTKTITAHHSPPLYARRSHSLYLDASKSQVNIIKHQQINPPTWLHQLAAHPFTICKWHFIYLLLVKTNGVAFLEPLRRAKDCSFPSLAESLPAPLPEKGQTPLALDPLPPMLRDKASLFTSWSFLCVCVCGGQMISINYRSLDLKSKSSQRNQTFRLDLPGRVWIYDYFWSKCQFHGVNCRDANE